MIYWDNKLIKMNIKKERKNTGNIKTNSNSTPTKAASKSLQEAGKPTQSRVGRNGQNLEAFLQNQLPQVSREILDRVPTANKKYSSEVLKATKLRIMCNLDYMNAVLKEKNKDTICYAKEDSIENLAIKALAVYRNICTWGYKSLFHEKGLKDLENEEIPVDISPEAYLNGKITWTILHTIYGYTPQECLIPEFKLDTGNDKEITSLDALISDTIKELKKIKNKNFEGFRILLDPQLNLDEKWEQSLKFHPQIQAITLLNGKDSQFSSWQHINLVTEGYAKEIFQLQNFIVCLIALKYAPKTIENLKICYQFLRPCYDQNYKKVETPDTPYIANKNAVKKYLCNILTRFAHLINEETTNHNLKASANSQTHSLTLKANQLPQKPQSRELKNNKGNEGLSTKVNHTLPAIQHPDLIAKPKAVSIENKAIPAQNVEAERFLAQDAVVESKSPILVPKESSRIDENAKNEQVGAEKKAIILNQPLDIKVKATTYASDDALDEDSDDVEDQKNLMEVLLQRFDSDRTEKQRLKQEKLTTPKKEVESEFLIPLHQTESVKEFYWTKTHQETLAELLKPNPQDFIIKDTEVQSLLKIIGGKSIGIGGSYRRISWADSKKNGGVYEVAHGEDRGCLSSRYAGIVAKSIWMAVKNNWVNVDNIPEDMLTLIRNYAPRNEG